VVLPWSTWAMMATFRTSFLRFWLGIFISSGKRRGPAARGPEPGMILPPRRRRNAEMVAARHRIYIQT
ncbi:MAG: hypothetical protein KAT30_05495, partial [Candidatus Krumholzibacteria bacterium]|nr:hypothetical protein [Candidatus Krumholzibacteria bacterium]